MQDILTTAATIIEIALGVVIVYGALTHKPKAQPASTVEPEPAPSRTEQLKAKFGTTLKPVPSVAPHLTVADVETALTKTATVADLQELGIRELRKMAKGKCRNLATATKAKLIAALLAA
ncbi:hypothetical protein [Pantanalinema sp. GBBB05]|uniref:hypothetical protein n=1 Tax=Pantanalinema sp. GBBB05 TaxID=2604139 RepID=UPI001D827B4F|nr:hypothetical protein [Pantanalinema sp. GBBB05]